jgi:hypothetical protein
MSSTEGFARTGQHDAAHRGVHGDGIQFTLHCVQHCLGQRVELQRTIHAKRYDTVTLGPLQQRFFEEGGHVHGCTRIRFCWFKVQAGIAFATTLTLALIELPMKQFL